MSVACCALACWTAACRTAPSPDARPAPSSDQATSSASRAAARASNPAPPAAARSGIELTPLSGPWIEPLPLEGGGTAFVCPPIGSTEPRPVVVAGHGAADRAEWACGGWRLASKSSVFVVCPQGKPVPGERFTWPSGAALASAAQQALAAAERRYGARIAKSPRIYAGFSQGAILARTLLVQRPTPFQIAVFAEGGYATLKDPSFARAYRDAGGERLLVVCGGATCFAQASHAEKILRSGGLEVLVAGDRRAGHNLNERMQVALQRVWPSFVAGREGGSPIHGEPHEGSMPRP